MRKGCTMGIICASSYANIFMGKFEEKFIYPYIKDLSSLYLHYIDDIFMIWTGIKNQFHQFFSAPTICHHSIQFDHDISPNDVHFLDRTVCLDNNGALQTKLYKKPTDRHKYLHKRSEHPESSEQAICIRRVCSDEKKFRDSCLELIKKLYL